MIAALLVWTFRAFAAYLLLPLAGRAALAGQWVAAAFVVALLVVACNLAAYGDDDD